MQTFPRQLSGDVRYNGLTSAELRASGVYLGQLVQYVGQLDEHSPFLTVRETLRFVAQNALAPAVTAATEARVSETIRLLRLQDCADTVVGNALLHGSEWVARRGCGWGLRVCGWVSQCALSRVPRPTSPAVSGGEMKRLTVGEGILTNARFLALDEISTGGSRAAQPELGAACIDGGTVTGVPLACRPRLHGDA